MTFFLTKSLTFFRDFFLVIVFLHTIRPDHPGYRNKIMFLSIFFEDQGTKTHPEMFENSLFERALLVWMRRNKFGHGPKSKTDFKSHFKFPLRATCVQALKDSFEFFKFTNCLPLNKNI